MNMARGDVPDMSRPSLPSIFHLSPPIPIPQPLPHPKLPPVVSFSRISPQHITSTTSKPSPRKHSQCPPQPLPPSSTATTPKAAGLGYCTPFQYTNMSRPHSKTTQKLPPQKKGSPDYSIQLGTMGGATSPCQIPPNTQVNIFKNIRSFRRISEPEPGQGSTLSVINPLS